MVFTLLEQPKTSSPLQSLATDAMEEQWGPIAASTLILIKEMEGGVHWCEGAKVAWLETKGLVDLCSRNNLEILEDSSSTFIATPSKRERFLCFQITSHKIAQKSKKSSFWHTISSSANGGEKRKLMRSWMEARPSESVLTPHWLWNQSDLAMGQRANMWRGDSSNKLQRGHPTSTLANWLMTSLVGRTFVAILHKCIFSFSCSLDFHTWPWERSIIKGGEEILPNQ